LCRGTPRRDWYGNQRSPLHCRFKNAARDEFAERGFLGAKVDDIADSVDLITRETAHLAGDGVVADAGSSSAPPGSAPATRPQPHPSLVRSVNEVDDPQGRTAPNP
jgi:hypothetical protein